MKPLTIYEAYVCKGRVCPIQTSFSKEEMEREGIRHVQLVELQDVINVKEVKIEVKASSK